MIRLGLLIALLLSLTPACLSLQVGDRTWYCDDGFTAYDGDPHLVCAAVEPTSGAWEILVDPLRRAVRP